MGFNYGVNEADMKSVNTIKLWPVEGERTALIDADSIAYVIGYTSNLQQYFKVKRSKNYKETDTWKEKINHANFLINKWVENAKCDSAKLYLTDGAKNFRIKIAVSVPYKGQRVQEKPPFFYEIREWLTEYHHAIMSDCCEADDEISIEAWRRHLAFDGELWTPEHRKFSDFVIVSGDKDLGIIPGWRRPPNGELEWVDPLGNLDPVWKEREVVAYEYWPLFKGKIRKLSACCTIAKYKGELQVRHKDQVECPKLKWETDYIWFYDSISQDKYLSGKSKGKGKFKRVKVGYKKSEYLHKLKGTGLKFFYSQLLTGDTADNFKGLPGVGNVKAYEVLDDAKSEQELVSRVRQLYKKEYKNDWETKLLEQGQLAHMQTKKGELWKIPKSNEQTFPV